LRFDPRKASAIAWIFDFFIYQHFSLDKPYLVLYSYRPFGHRAGSGVLLASRESQPRGEARWTAGGFESEEST